MAVCSCGHGGRGTAYARPNVTVIEDPDGRGAFIAIRCSHCAYPLCAAACPSGAVRKDPATGVVLINPVLCVGCRSCALACPISAPWFDETSRIARKCDLCQGDPLGPKCVRNCPAGALSVMSREDARAALREEARPR